MEAKEGELRGIILAEIRERGAMSFRRYMELCLYHPELGYYRRKDGERFGRAGDYYTSSQLGSVFARLMAQRFRQMAAELGEFTLLEVGPGRGDFARGLGDIPYVGVEVGDPWPARPIVGCIFANEFFDSLPVEVFDAQGREVKVIERDGVLAWDGKPARERAPDAAQWLRRFADTLQRGYVIIADYGYRGVEAERFPQGSLMTYRRHAACSDVFADPGERDITAHVDFDLLARAGEAAGLRESTFQPQSSYLMRLGEGDEFAAVFGDCRSEAERLPRALQLKNLLFGIGAVMRVLEMRKG
jgi:SAM-dependent MidA family methyltransferase